MGDRVKRLITATATLATAGVAMAGMSVAQADAASLRPCDDPEYVTDRDDYVYAPLVLSSHYGRDCDMVWAGRGHGLFYELAMRIDRGKYPAPGQLLRGLAGVQHEDDPRRRGTLGIPQGTPQVLDRAAGGMAMSLVQIVHWDSECDCTPVLEPMSREEALAELAALPPNDRHQFDLPSVETGRLVSWAIA